MDKGFQYPTIVVPASARIGDEPMGSKSKFWWQDTASAPQLFKQSRPNTGEHWSEKVASELGQLLGVPCAHVELATCNGEIGCVVRSFVNDRSTPLVHGNELLQEVDETYPAYRVGGVSKHTVGAVSAVLENTQSPFGAIASDALRCGADWFVGYLLLDAVILNTDRHHENWAVLQRLDGARQLAPSYDHASSLGRELSDEVRATRMIGKDRRQTVATYVARARSAFYVDGSDTRPVHPGRAFELAATLRPAAATHWLEQLEALTTKACADVLDRVPSSAISEPARAFAKSVIEEALRFTRVLMRPE